MPDLRPFGGDHDGHTINVGPVTIGEPVAMPPEVDRIIKWCATHDDVAVVYGDKSVSCRWELVVETYTNDHVLTDLPEISRLRATIAALVDLVADMEADR